MMNFMNPHTILLSRANLRDIHYTTGAQYEALNDLLAEAANEATLFYIVAKRSSTTGLPEWRCMTQAELKEEFDLEEISSRIDTNFTKM